MSTPTLISLIVLCAILIPAAVFIFFIFRHEYETRERVTDGNGIPVILGLILIYVIMPIVVFISSLK